MDRELLDGESLFVIHDFLSAEECERLIERSETLGYKVATLNGELVPELRNNARLIVEDAELAGSLWERARPLLPERRGPWLVDGLNPRFRFYRYSAAEAFAAHSDGCIRLGSFRESKLTFMVYLNDVAKGGQTRFFGPGAAVRFEVRPERGKALVFEHRLIHEGAEVVDGQKYVLRSDVMYRRPWNTQEQE
jgi:hypothetical protein